MVLYLDKYEKIKKGYGNYLHYYNALPDYLHKMKAEEIFEHINRNGVPAAMYQKIAVMDYLRWLATNYGTGLNIDLTELVYNLTQLTDENNGVYIGFYTLDEMKQVIEKKLQELESENMETPRNVDFNGLKATFFLEWYGIPLKTAIAIKLNDVSDDGTQVYVKDENRVIFIDDTGVANYFTEYKQRTGFKKYRKKDDETPYSQNTFYRTTSNAPISMKTIYNIKSQFQSVNPDKRFDKRRVYYAGRYYCMFQEEQSSDNIFICGDKWTQNVINKVFNFQEQQDIQIYTRILRDYRLYKIGYLEI